MKKHPVAVIGAGSWATALASLLSQNGRSVAMWSRSEEVAEEINRSHMNAKYLSDVRLSDKVYCSTSLKEVVNDASQVLLVVPSHALREVVRNLKPHLKKEALLIHATKGLEIDTRKRMSEVIADELSPDALQRVAVLSGPSHAEEVARSIADHCGRSV